jgi:hypothetical protein
MTQIYTFSNVMKKISALLLFHIFISCTSKPDIHKKQLLAIESVKINQGCTMDIQAKYIVRYNFENGQLVSKDTLNTNKEGLSNFQIKLFRQTSDSVFIYKNKYIISSRGAIFDLETKTFTNVNQRGANGHPIEFPTEYVNDIYEETGYLLKRESYYPTRGILSPDKKHGLQSYNLMNVQPIINAGEILLFDSTNTQQTIVHTGGMGTHISNVANQQAHIPVYWLDNRTFMYAKYLFPVIDSLADIEMHKVDIYTKSDEKLCTINRVSKAILNARFYTDVIGNLLFVHNEIVYQLNKKSNTISEIHYEEQDHGFKTEISFLHFLNKKEQTITFNDLPIGKFYYLNSSAKTSEGYIAIAALKAPICSGNDMKIWNSYTKEWITIHSFASIIPIGWIEE